MHQKLQRLQLTLVNRKSPILLHDNTRPHFAQPTLQKLNKLASELLPYLPYLLGLLLTNYTSSNIPTTFWRKNTSTTSRRQKNAFQEYWLPKYGILCHRNKHTYFVGKNVLTVMVPILINRDVFEPSCNDLKFPVQNSNYFYTNLIYTPSGN